MGYQPGKEIEWAKLLEEALTLPGSLGNTYNRFYEYSFANQLLLYMQGAREPVASYKRWQDLGRQVVKGSKAMAILRPIMGKFETEAGDEVTRVRGFKMVNCLFPLSQTEGDPLPDVQPRTWDRARALRALGITDVPFRMVNGNVQGFSEGKNISINPVAAYPLKTTMHELGHVVLTHTTPEGLAEYRTHRGVMEFQAESTAYLAMNELEVPADAWDPAESRAYVQTWLRGERPTDQAIKSVFAATTAILKAGREPVLEAAA